MEKELEVAMKLAREAGRVIMEIYRGDHEVRWKGYDDPVTTADHVANEMIVSALRREFPADGILAEETPDDRDRLTRRRVWMIDPMDGTKQFIERVGEFAVMIGLAIEGEAQLGVVYHPALDRLYYAAPGLGAYVEEQWTTKQLRVATITDLTRMTVTVSRSHHSPTVDRVRERLGIKEVIRSGSVGLKFGLIAEARAHIYIQPGSRTSHWDSCGPEAILRAAGGRVTDLTGAPLCYNTSEIRNLRGIIATSGPAHDQVVAAMGAILAERQRRQPEK